MADTDTYEQNLGQKTSLTASDFIRVVGSDNVSYKQPLSDLNIGKIVISGSFNDLTSSGIYYCSNLTEQPSTGITQYALVVCANSTKVLVRQIAYSVTADDAFWSRHLQGGSWSEWTRMPTRAEINALNSNSGTQIATLTNATPGGNASFYYKKGNVVTFFFDLTPATSGASVTVFTFPAGYRPAENLRFTLSPVVHDSSEASIGTAFAVISTNGTVQFYISSARRVFLTGSFGVA